MHSSVVASAQPPLPIHPHTRTQSPAHRIAAQPCLAFTILTLLPFEAGLESEVGRVDRAVLGEPGNAGGW